MLSVSFRGIWEEELETKCPGKYSLEFLVGVSRPVLQIFTLFQIKLKLSFFTPVDRPGLKEIMSP